MSNGWIAFDLDGTLAEYHGWQGLDHIGSPIMPMVDLLKSYRAGGTEVRIFTARVCREGEEHTVAVNAIERWCIEHLGEVLPVTNKKDFGMIILYDDRCVQVEANTGRIIE